MKSLYFIFTLLLVTHAASNCQTPTKKPVTGSIIESDREIAGNEIREFGRISNIEDSGYPMFIVSVEFPERQMNIDFNLNAEAIGLDAGQLTKLKGKFVLLYYLSEIEQNIYDIHYTGISLLGEYAPDLDPEWEKVTGTFKGAGAQTAGDLPDEISVIDANDVKFTFKYFITPEMVAVNGKSVTVFYGSDNVQTITYLRVSKDKT